MSKYTEVFNRSISDPEGFWAEQQRHNFDTADGKGARLSNVRSTDGFRSELNTATMRSTDMLRLARRPDSPDFTTVQ